MRVPPPTRQPATRPGRPRPAAPTRRPATEDRQWNGAEPLGTNRFRLADGTTLSDPTDRTVAELTIGDWVLLDGTPWYVRDLRARPDRGKIIHLEGREPDSRSASDPIKVFTRTARPA
ncbi:hypothetical protein ACFWXO_13540 [Kitasatospora sp. NPDC059088]|uniref:hypothetical protein n=1 Tax=Kitasatospora sp. NPDC059088 TaxID=3346722 RepID=UPI003681B1E0